MYRTVADFSRAWQGESASSHEVMSTLTDASPDQKVSPEGRTLGRIGWRIVQTLGEMGGQAGLAIEAAVHWPERAARTNCCRTRSVGGMLAPEANSCCVREDLCYHSEVPL